MKKTALMGLMVMSLAGGCTTQNFEVDRVIKDPNTGGEFSASTFIDSQERMTCPYDRAVKTIKIEYNIPQSAINIITLGLYKSYKLSYTCGKLQPCTTNIITGECVIPDNEADEG